MIMRVFIENEAGSNQKNIFNEETFEYKKTYTVSAQYPFAYGFIPQTRSGDGDSLDCFVLTTKPLKSGELVEVDVVGMFEEVEDGEADHKILVVPKGDIWEIDTNLEDLFKDFSAKVFSHLPGKKKEIGRFLGIDEANALIEESIIK